MGRCAGLPLVRLVRLRQFVVLILMGYVLLSFLELGLWYKEVDEMNANVGVIDANLCRGDRFHRAGDD